MSGTWGGSACVAIRAASSTYARSVAGSTGGRSRTWPAWRMGRVIWGPSPAANVRPSPSGSNGSRMSANRIAASTPRRSTGWSVTWAASSGLWHRSSSECFCRSRRYSGRERPACRMNHTGVTSVGSERHAFRKRLSSGARGNRLARVDRTGASDEHGVALDLHSIGGDRKRGRPAQHLPRLERKDAFVPRARHRTARRIDGAFREAGARVRAAVGDGVHGAVHVEERDGVAAHVDPPARAGREVGQRPAPRGTAPPGPPARDPPPPAPPPPAGPQG